MRSSSWRVRDIPTARGSSPPATCSRESTLHRLEPCWLDYGEKRYLARITATATRARMTSVATEANGFDASEGTRTTPAADGGLRRRVVRAELKVLALIDHLALGGAEMLLGQFGAAAPAAGIRLSVTCLSEVGGNPAAKPLRAIGIEPVLLNAPERLGPGALMAVLRHISA